MAYIFECMEAHKSTEVSMKSLRAQASFQHQDRAEILRESQLTQENMRKMLKANLEWTSENPICFIGELLQLCKCLFKCTYWYVCISKGFA